MDVITRNELSDYYYRIKCDDGKVSRYDIIVGFEYYFSKRFGKPDKWIEEGNVNIKYAKKSNIIPSSIHATVGENEYKITLEKNKIYSLDEIRNGEHVNDYYTTV